MASTPASILFSGLLEVNLDSAPVLSVYQRQQFLCAGFIIHVMEKAESMGSGTTATNNMSVREGFICSQGA